MLKYVNLTPHTINIHKEDGSILTVEPDGRVARVESQSTLHQVIDGVGFYYTDYGEVQNLPEPFENCIYIVSAMVKDRCLRRSDVVSPGELVRDDAGRPVGCRGLRP